MGCELTGTIKQMLRTRQRVTASVRALKEHNITTTGSGDLSAGKPKAFPPTPTPADMNWLQPHHGKKKGGWRRGRVGERQTDREMAPKEL